MDSNQLMREQEQRQQKIQEWESTLGVSEGYIPDLTRINENVRNHMRNYNIISIYSVIERQMPGVYNNINARLQGNDLMEKMMPLYSRKGIRYMTNNYHVFELDMAGSTYKQFPRGNKEISGMWEYSHMEEIKDVILNVLMSTIVTRNYFWEPSNEDVRLFSLWFYFQRMELVEEMHQKDEDELDALGDRLDVVDDFYDKEALSDVIGHNYIRRVRQKVGHEQITKYSIAGPCVLNCRGEYTTTDSRKYMLALATDYLKSRLGKPDEKHMPERPICIKIKGHSRGGVTAAEGAAMIRRWLIDTYGVDYANSVLFDIIQFDPVPGADTFYETANKFDFRRRDAGVGPNGEFESSGEKYASLNDNDRITVIYSMFTEYPLAFTPQSVNGADRIIITPFKHSSGLDIEDTDNNPVVDMQGSISENGHMPAFIDAETQRAYRMGSLNDLGRGVYMLDEHNVLVKMNNYEGFKNIMDEIYKKTNWKTVFQIGRRNVLLATVKEWFERERQ